LPKPYIHCLVVRYFGLLVKNRGKGGNRKSFKLIYFN
jgi:hypothetical protein